MAMQTPEKKMKSKVWTNLWAEAIRMVGTVGTTGTVAVPEPQASNSN